MILYGSNVADSVLTSACDLASASGGVETSATTTNNATPGTFMEVTSKGLSNVPCRSSLPAPTGNGWVYSPGAGTFAADNWSAVLTFACSIPNAGASTLRFYQYTGTYTSIGNLTFTPTSSAKTTYTLSAVSMPATTFNAGDLLYVDLWYQDSSGIGGDTATIYESTSATAGVANDVQITPSAFTPAGTVAILDIATRFLLEDPPPLVLYGSATLDSTLPTASDMTTATGGTETSAVSTFTVGTGNFGEVWSQGTASGTQMAAIPTTPTGHGWVYRPGAGTILQGNWSAVLTLAVTIANAGVSTLRFFLYSQGVYTAIGNLTFTPTAAAKTTYSLTPALMPAVTFGAADLLYIDLWYQDSSGLGGDSATIYESTSVVAGVTNDFQITTYNWQPAIPVPSSSRHRPRWVMRPIMGGIFTPFQEVKAWVERAFTAPFVRPTQPVNIPHYVRRSLTSILINYGLNISTRLRLRSADTLRDIASRLILTSNVQVLRDITTRFRVRSSDQLKDILARLRLRSTDQLKDIAGRLRLMSAVQTKDIANRVRLRSLDKLSDISARLRQRSADQLKDINARLRLQSANQLKDVASRLRQRSADLVRDMASRLRLRSADQQKDISTRLRQRSADQLKDIASRLKLAKFVDVATRLRLVASQFKDVRSRLRLRSADQLKDITGRVRVRSADQLKDVASRLRQRSADQLKDTVARLRLRSADQLKDITARLRLAKFVDIASRLRLRSANQLKDVSARLRLRSSDKLSDVAARLRQRSADQARDVTTRLRQRSADQLKDVAARLRLRSTNQLKDVAARFWLVLGTNRKDITSRLRQRSANQLKDITSRLVLALATQRFKDVFTRFRLRSADKLVDLASRVRLRSADQARDVTSRFRQRSANLVRDVAARVRLMSAARLLDVSGRLRQRSADQPVDVSSRFRQMSVIQRKDMASRVRMMSAMQLRDIASRLRQISQPQPHDIRGRLILVIFAVTPKDIHCRLILVEYHVSRITVMAPRGHVDVEAPRGQLTAVSARGTLTVKEE